MKPKRIKLTKLPLPLVGMLILIIGFLIVSPPKHAAAACIACIPGDIQSTLNAYDTWDHDGGQPDGECYGQPGVNPPYYGRTTDWISQVDNSANDYPHGETLPYNYTPASGALSLQLNDLIYICHPATQGGIVWPTDGPVLPSNYTQVMPSPPIFTPGIFLPAVNNYDFYNPSVSGGAYISPLGGANSTSICFQSATRFWFNGSPAPCNPSGAATFTFEPPAGLGPGTYNYNITIPEVVTSTYVENLGAYGPGCPGVDQGGTCIYTQYDCVTGDYVMATSTSPCTIGSTSFPISVTINGPPLPETDLVQASCTVVRGWAEETADPNETERITVLDSSDWNNYFTLQANQSSVNYGVPGNHAFIFDPLNSTTYPAAAWLTDALANNQSVSLTFMATSPSTGQSSFFSNAGNPGELNDPVTIGPCGNGPKITATASCSLQNIAVQVSANGAPRQTFPVSYQIFWHGFPVTGVTNVVTNNSGYYSINMAPPPLDQLQVYSVNISTSYGKFVDIPPANNPVAYGPNGQPCYYPTCSPPSPSVPGDVNGEFDGPTPGQNFSLVGILTIKPNPFAENSTTFNPNTMSWNGTFTVSFNGTSQSTSPPNTTLKLNNLSAPAGWASDGESFSDTSFVGVNCPSQLLIGNHPTFDVQGGDVKSGSGGFQPSTAVPDTCSSTGSNSQQSNAGILAFNDGSDPTDPALYNAEGSGDNLAAFAPNLVDGFATSNGRNGYAGSGYSAALTFANSAPYTGNPDAENFGGDFANTTDVGTSWCSTNYYATASTNTPWTTPQGGAGTTVNLSTLVGQHASPCYTTTLTTGSVTYCWFTGPISFTDPTPLPAGSNLVVYVSGNSYIDSTGVSLSQGPWSSVSAIPTFYLVDQGNINVSYQATEIDGVYVAQPSSANTDTGGYISTCTNGPDIGPGNTGEFPADGSGALYSNCDQPLTINGAVVAQQVRLARTSGNVNSNPAELFTYNPTVWLNDPFIYGAVIPGTPQYQYEEELPPVL